MNTSSTDGAATCVSPATFLSAGWRSRGCRRSARGPGRRRSERPSPTHARMAGAGRGSRVGADRWRSCAGDADLPGSRRGSRPGPDTQGRRRPPPRQDAWRPEPPIACSWWRRPRRVPGCDSRRRARRCGDDRPSDVRPGCAVQRPGIPDRLHGTPYWHLSAVGLGHRQCSRSRSRSPACGRVVDPRRHRALIGPRGVGRLHPPPRACRRLRQLGAGFTVLGACCSGGHRRNR